MYQIIICTEVKYKWRFYHFKQLYHWCCCYNYCH